MVSTIEGAQEAAAVYASRLRLTATSAQIDDLLRDRPMLPRENDIQLIRATLHHLGVDWGTRLIEVVPGGPRRRSRPQGMSRRRRERYELGHSQRRLATEESSRTRVEPDLP